MNGNSALSSSEEEEANSLDKIRSAANNISIKYPDNFPPYLLEYIEQDRRIFEEEIEDSILAIVSFVVLSARYLFF